jgi:hypothetical protein
MTSDVMTELTEKSEGEYVNELRAIFGTWPKFDQSKIQPRSGVIFI